MRKHMYIGALAAVMFLAGCGSTDLGSILGGGSGSPSSSISEIRGVVDSIDMNSRSMVLRNVTAYRSSLADGGNVGSGNSARVYFDNNTSVSYQGRTYRPEDLERGDEVAVQIDQTNNGQLYARAMSVLYDSSGTGSSSGSAARYDSVVRGTVMYVDTNRRTIELDRPSWRSGFNSGSGSTNAIILQYDTNTPVEFNGRAYSASNLERGDVVDVQVRDLGSNRWLAERIIVVRDVNTSF